jgi:hypothetical protein
MKLLFKKTQKVIRLQSNLISSLNTDILIIILIELNLLNNQNSWN